MHMFGRVSGSELRLVNEVEHVGNEPLVVLVVLLLLLEQRLNIMHVFDKVGLLHPVEIGHRDRLQSRDKALNEKKLWSAKPKSGAILNHNVSATDRQSD